MQREALARLVLDSVRLLDVLILLPIVMLGPIVGSEVLLDVMLLRLPIVTLLDVPMLRLLLDVPRLLPMVLLGPVVLVSVGLLNVLVLLSVGVLAPVVLGTEVWPFALGLLLS